MVKIVLIRGASAVGKTIITKSVLDELKDKHNQKCAYISERHFTTDMQTKYDYYDKNVHLNAFELIKTVILKLLDLDEYDFIFVEGRFKLKEVLDQFETFVNKENLEAIYFHLFVDVQEMVDRNNAYKNYSQRDVLSSRMDVESYVPNNFFKINTKQSVENSVSEILNKLV